MKKNFNKEQFYKRNQLLSESGFSTYQDFLLSKEWQELKRYVKKKAKTSRHWSMCFTCGKKENLHIHHRRYDLGLLSKRSLVMMCADCHKELHEMSRNLNWSFRRCAKAMSRANNFSITGNIGVKVEDKPRRKWKPVVVGNGETCKKCNKIMERRKHSIIPITDKFYFSEWDYCNIHKGGCGVVQHYEKYKVEN